MNDPATFAHWIWGGLLALGAWPFKAFAGRLHSAAHRLRLLELGQQKVATENRALFKRLDELRDSIHDLAGKLDRFMDR